MKSLNAISPPPDYIDIFEDIRDKKKKAARAMLVAAEASIRSRFIHFEICFAANTLHGLPPSVFAHIKNELRSCYGKNVGMVALQKAIKQAQPKGRLVWCPYCGATTPGSHDHYLPAEKFPEFSAHALNLVPSCTRCNSIKDDDWLDAAGARQYLHFYRDAIPVAPFLTVNVSSNTAAQAVGATFSIQRAGMPASSWALIESHFRKLHLIELYDSYSNDLINLALRSVRSHLSAGGADAAGFLAGEALEAAELYGEYGWRAVLLGEMSTHPHLDQWVSWL